MPSFHRFPAEAARIGRIIAAFGELEFILGVFLGEALDNQDAALRAMFRLLSDRARLDLADALLRPHIERVSLVPQLDTAMSVVWYCREIRNQYAHCHYGDQLGHGLFLTNLTDAAERPDSFEYQWRHVDVPLLDEQEQYFLYAMECLQTLSQAYRVRAGKTGVPHVPPWPKEQKRPLKHNPPTQHIPPWIGEDATRRHKELALEYEYSVGLRPRPPKARKEPKPSARARRDAAIKRAGKRPHT
jgi:hypothetical protein